MKNKLILLVSLLCCLSVNAEKPATLQEKDMGAYLFVFFSDPTHSLFMATSHDGYTFTAVNNGQPIINGDKVLPNNEAYETHISHAVLMGRFISA